MKKIFRIITDENGVKWNRLFEKSNNEYKKNSNVKPASPKEKFDFYIKQSLLSGASYLPKLTATKECNYGFYVKRYNQMYDRYLSDSLDIKKKLSCDIQCFYKNGKGQEFKSGKYYSVASSSRFATSCFSENHNGFISLKKQLTINGKETNINILLEKDLNFFSNSNKDISQPQIDVFIETPNDIYFIEVKCHEIFDSHKNIKLKWKYTETKLLDLLIKTNKLLTPIEREENGKKVQYIGLDNKLLTSKDFGIELTTHHFDFKQFLCHLMGIISYQPQEKAKNIHFYYLFYKNERFVEEERSNIYKELEQELNMVFNFYGNKYPEIDFGYLYHDQFDTIKNFVPIYQTKK